MRLAVCDASHPFAYYNNLAGDYSFLLKSYQFQLNVERAVRHLRVILPPPWNRVGLYAGYALMLCSCVICLPIVHYRSRCRTPCLRSLEQRRPRR